MNSYGSLRVDYCLLSSHLGIMKASFPSALGLSSVGCFQFLFGIFLCLNQLHSYYVLALNKESYSKIILKSSQYNL